MKKVYNHRKAIQNHGVFKSHCRYSEFKHVPSLSFLRWYWVDDAFSAESASVSGLAAGEAGREPAGAHSETPSSPPLPRTWVCKAWVFSVDGSGKAGF